MTVKDRLPRFDWSFNFGHVMLVAGTLASVAATWGSVSYFFGRLEERLVGFERRLIASEQRGALYAPRVDSLESENKVQNERIGNLADSQRELRKTLGDLTNAQQNFSTQMLTAMGSLGRDVAVLAATQQRGGVPLPSIR